MIGEPGPTVGLFSAYIPRELLYALGCTPVRVFPTAGKPTAAEAYLPRNFCALTRLILASFLENGSSGLDAAIFADEDDATRRLYDVWRASVSVPVWGFVEVPRGVTPLATNRYADLLLDLATDLEAHTGRSPNVDDLRQATALYNQQRGLLTELKRHWLGGGVGTATYRRLRRLTLTRDPMATNRQLERYLKEVEAGEHQQGAHRLITPGASGPLRLLLIADLAAPNGLVRLVEANGVQIVAEDSDLDELDLADPVPTHARTVGGLLVALAETYLSKPPGPRMRDLPRRMAHLTQLVAARGVQAAICAYSKFCDLHLTEFPALKAHLDGLGIPILLLELEDETIGGQHRTRVEAFLELVSVG